MERENRRRNRDSSESLDRWVERVAFALRHLEDRSKLNGSPLARLAYVERLAKEEYAGRLLPRGLALRQLVLACVDDVVKEVGEEPGLSRACQYLTLRASGLSCKQVSRKMNLSREHVSRLYRRRALALLAEQVRFAVNGSQ